MPKSKRLVPGQGRLPLSLEIQSDFTLEGTKQKQRNKGSTRAKKRASTGREGKIPVKLSNKIFQVARAQLAEEEDEEIRAQALAAADKRRKTPAPSSSSHRRSNANDDDDDDDDNDPESKKLFAEFSSDDEHDDIDVEAEIELNAADAEALERWMSREPPSRRTLHDVVMERLTALENKELESGLAAAPKEVVERLKQRLDAPVVQLYTDIGALLKAYTGGRVPIAFKLLPRMDNWEELLWLTHPHKWSPAAMYYATRLFASNLNARLAQRFFNLVLYPRVRQDIAQHKKLHYHLYLSLKKCLYKPGAFFKGILLPLCEERNATLREALIIASVVDRKSIPVLHSAAALMRIANGAYSGANSIFIRVIVDKKYSLPLLVIDSLVGHFSKFAQEERQLPVLWHQSFLSFAQRYKTQLTRQQKIDLKPVLAAHVHPIITPLIKQELYSSLSRDDTL